MNAHRPLPKAGPVLTAVQEREAANALHDRIANATHALAIWRRVAAIEPITTEKQASALQLPMRALSEELQQVRGQIEDPEMLVLKASGLTDMIESALWDFMGSDEAVPLSEAGMVGAAQLASDLLGTYLAAGKGAQ